MQQLPPVQSVDPRALALRPVSGMVLLDVLMPERHAQKRLPGSVNACVFEVTFPDQVRALVPDPATPVLCYGHDHTTQDAAMAADKLLRLGYTRVQVLAGGLKAWEAEGLPLEGDLAGQEDGPDASPLLPDGRWSLVGAESRIEWTGRNRTGRHVGTVQASHGSLRVEEGALAGIVTLDMRSLQNQDLEDPTLRSMLVAHLLSEDFFLAAEHPQAEFEILSAAFLEEATASTPNVELHGALTLRGQTAPLALPATVHVLPASETQASGLAIEAHFDLDRTRWGAVYGSARHFKYLGYHLVFDPVSIALRLVFR